MCGEVWSICSFGRKTTDMADMLMNILEYPAHAEMETFSHPVPFQTTSPGAPLPSAWLSVGIWPLYVDTSPIRVHAE